MQYLNPRKSRKLSKLNDFSPFSISQYFVVIFEGGGGGASISQGVGGGGGGGGGGGAGASIRQGQERMSFYLDRGRFSERSWSNTNFT